jgi:hypothetical protein
VEDHIDPTFSGFASWLDDALVGAPLGITAFCFNLYEHDDAYALQVVGTHRFDRADTDWAVDPILFTPEEHLFLLDRRSGDNDWQRGLKEATALIHRYLREGKYAATLRQSQGVGCGFVDGDIAIVWPAA